MSNINIQQTNSGWKKKTNNRTRLSEGIKLWYQAIAEDVKEAERKSSGRNNDWKNRLING
jgi:hypothetical protein